jgi:hypothetical protein
MDNVEAMPRYAYDKLVVACLHSVEFAPTEMRAAVECLRQTPNDRPDRSWVGLMAEVTVRAGNYLLRAQPFLRLNEIVGRTPREVWEIFDKKVDEGIESLVRRG